MLVNDADNEDDDEGDGNHLQSTSYVPGTKLGSTTSIHWPVMRWKWSVKPFAMANIGLG